MDTCNFVNSEKGRKKLVDNENYVYHKHKENSDGSKIYWCCENRSCKARLQTDEHYEILKTNGNHDHSATAA